MKLLLKGALALNAEGTGFIRADVAVEKGKIALVGDCAGFMANEVISLDNCLLMPAFVNAHTHLPMTLFRGAADDMPLLVWLETRIWPMEDKLTAKDSLIAARLACAEMIRSGVSAFNDMYFFTDTFIEAVCESGLRGALCRAITSGENDFRVDEAIALYERWHGAENGRISISFGPHAEYTCSKETLMRTRDEAYKRGALFHIHCSESQEEHAQCIERHGATPVAWFEELGLLCERTLLAHCVQVTDDDIGLIASRGASVLHNPQSNLKLGSGIAPVPKMLKAGVNVALGTDGAASNNNLDMFEEMRLAATLHKGVLRDPLAVPADTALKTASVNGAKALNMGCKAIAKGEAADLVAISLEHPHMNPINDALKNVVYSAGMGDVMMNMTDGKILYYKGEYKTLDIERIKFEANEIAKRVCV